MGCVSAPPPPHQPHAARLLPDSLAAPVLPLQVKLRELVDYVSDVLAFTCASSAADALLGPAADALGAQLKGALAVMSGREEWRAEGWARSSRGPRAAWRRGGSGWRAVEGAASRAQRGLAADASAPEAVALAGAEVELRLLVQPLPASRWAAPQRQLRR